MKATIKVVERAIVQSNELSCHGVRASKQTVSETNAEFARLKREQAKQLEEMKCN